MYAAIASNMKIGKGGLYIAPWVGTTPPAAEDIGEKVGNCESLTYGPQDVQTLEKYSSTQAAAPLVAKFNTRASWRFAAACDEHTKQNLLMFFGAEDTEVVQAATSDVAVELTSITLGRSYHIGAFHVDGFVAQVGSDVLVQDTDYTLFPERGVIEFRLDAANVVTGDDVDLDFDQPARTYNRLAVGQNINRKVKLTYFADDNNTDGIGAGDGIMVPKLAVVLDGQYPLISEEFGSFTLNFDAESDEANFPGRGLGWILRGAA